MNCSLCGAEIEDLENPDELRGYSLWLSKPQMNLLYKEHGYICKFCFNRICYCLDNLSKLGPCETIAPTLF